jgi:hypothetical protein
MRVLITSRGLVTVVVTRPASMLETNCVPMWSPHPVVDLTVCLTSSYVAHCAAVSTAARTCTPRSSSNSIQPGGGVQTAVLVCLQQRTKSLDIVTGDIKRTLLGLAPTACLVPLLLYQRMLQPFNRAQPNTDNCHPCCVSMHEGHSPALAWRRSTAR